MPGIAFAVIGAVGVTLFQWYLQMGLLLFMLKVARGEPFEFSDLFYVGPQVLPFFARPSSSLWPSRRGSSC